jgi:hypothetical protein
MALPGGDAQQPQPGAPANRRNGMLVSKGREVVTVETIRERLQKRIEVT